MGVLAGGSAPLCSQGALGYVGHHDTGIESAFLHFVQVHEDFRVTLVEVYVLVKEHGSIAVAVEGENAVVHLACSTVVGSLILQPSE